MTGSLKAALLQALTIGLQEQEDCWFGLLNTRFDAEFAASDIISECEPQNGKFRTTLAPLSPRRSDQKTASDPRPGSNILVAPGGKPIRLRRPRSSSSARVPSLLALAPQSVGHIALLGTGNARHALSASARLSVSTIDTRLESRPAAPDPKSLAGLVLVKDLLLDPWRKPWLLT
jgi:hypothetical protein